MEHPSLTRYAWLSIAAAIATIRAPIGLFHSSRDPDTLALSTLAEIVRAYQVADFGAAHG